MNGKKERRLDKKLKKTLKASNTSYHIMENLSIKEKLQLYRASKSKPTINKGSLSIRPSAKNSSRKSFSKCKINIVEDVKVLKEPKHPRPSISDFPSDRKMQSSRSQLPIASSTSIPSTRLSKDSDKNEPVELQQHVENKCTLKVQYTENKDDLFNEEEQKITLQAQLLQYCYKYLKLKESHETFVKSIKDELDSIKNSNLQIKDNIEETRARIEYTSDLKYLNEVQDKMNLLMCVKDEMTSLHRSIEDNLSSYSLTLKALQLLYNKTGLYNF